MCFIYRNKHTPIHLILPRRMYTRGQSRAAEAQTENDNQPQLATAAEIVELRQVAPQQAKLMQKHVEEARKREEELTHRQNDLFEAFMQRFQFVRVRT